MNKITRHILIRGLTLSPLILLNYGAAASDINITASFVADGLNPDFNAFRNTTRNSGYCANYPTVCGRDIFSISIPNNSSVMPVTTGTPVGLSVPYNWREVEVTRADGTSRKVEIRIVGGGSGYEMNRDVNHQTLWTGGRWIIAPPGCQATNLGLFSARGYTYFWRFNTANPCTKTPTLNATMYFRALNFMYQLRTPDPLNMGAGTYTGQVTYAIGPTGDFRFGAALFPDPIVRLNFTLSVQHVLRVKFPTGANLLALQPHGGWKQWLVNGDKFRPKKLISNQSFQLWASSKFKMRLQCQHTTGDDCAIVRGNSVIPVKTMVSLSSSYHDENKQPIFRYPLSSLNDANFQPTRNVINERATLHFEVDKKGVDEMIDSGGGRFRGDVTIVWDGDI